MTKRTTAYEEGQTARLAGRSRESNPYPADENRQSCLARAFNDGWFDQDEDIRREYRDDWNEEPIYKERSG